MADLEWDGEVEPVPGDQDGLHWRTRVEFTISGGGRLGLRGHRSHDIIKIDKSYIQNIGTDVVTDTFVSAVTQIAGKMDRTVVAEGIETETELGMVRDLGADLGTHGHLTALRREVPVLRDHDESVIGWYDETGAPMTDETWAQDERRTLQLHLAGEPAALLVVHGGLAEAAVTLPDVGPLRLRWDSAWERPAEDETDLPRVPLDERTVDVAAATIRVYLADDPT